jgi:hypothetical protein
VKLPSITAVYVGVLALLYAGLSLQIVVSDEEIELYSATVGTPSFAARSVRTRTLRNMCP